MNELLKIGTKLRIGSEMCRVERFLGAGGQGEVYEVTDGHEKLALKWYFPHTATKEQRRILEKLVLMDPPGAPFLWPLHVVEDPEGRTFGYLMKIRPARFKGVVDLMKRRVDPSFEALCRVGFNLTSGYEHLHSAGLCYQDISFGNLFFDPDTGEVLICDTDNVTENGKGSGVYGTPRFMAPEIVRGEAAPSRNTDLFSLAVLLFYMFMLSHPLEGKLEAQIKCLDDLAMKRLFGEDPVFIFDPEDARNRPLRGYQDNALVFWDLYPAALKNLFTRAFTAGLHHPGARVTERQWMDLFAQLAGSILTCPGCGAEIFYDEERSKMQTAHTCWNCGRVPAIPPRMNTGRIQVLLAPGRKVTAHQIYRNGDMDTVIGTVTRHPVNPDLLGLRNDSGENWVYEKSDGSQVTVPPGRNAGISPGTGILFGSAEGRFEF